jgi:hypothetical protein
LVTAAAGAGDTLVVTAKTKGTAGNAIASTETLGSGSWGAVTLAGGVDPTAAEFTTAFVAAVNAGSPDVSAARPTANTVAIANRYQDKLEDLATTETLSGTNNAFAAATLARSLSVDEASAAVVVSRIPNATEIALESMSFAFTFQPSAALVQVRTSSGAIKAWDGVTVISGSRVALNSTGTTDIGSGDVVTVIAQ